MTDEPEVPPTISDEDYPKLRRALVKFFTWHQAEDPNDLADETILRVIRKIHAGEKVENLAAYARSVAENVLHESQRKQSKRPDIDITRSADVGIELLHRCLEICKKKLSRQERSLVEAYFLGEKAAKISNRQKLALKKKTSIGGLRLRVSRICKKLAPCMEECLRQAAEAEMKSPLGH